MKARISDIKRFATHDGDGIRTTVFLKGCPLKCLWCHNPESIGSAPQLAYYPDKCIGCGACAEVCPVGAHTMEGGHVFHREKCIGCGACGEACLGEALRFYGKEMTVEELMEIVLRDKMFYDGSGGGVTLSGGECLMASDFCEAFLKALKEAGISTAVDTCGFVNKGVLDRVMPYTDVFLYDMKAVDEEVHIACTGQSNGKILENLRYLDSCGANIEIRIPFVPEHNADQIEKMAKVLSQLHHITKVRVLPYHNYAGSKYNALEMENTLPKVLPEKPELERARKILRDAGLRVVE